MHYAGRDEWVITPLYHWWGKYWVSLLWRLKVAERGFASSFIGRKRYVLVYILWLFGKKERGCWWYVQENMISEIWKVFLSFPAYPPLFNNTTPLLPFLSAAMFLVVLLTLHGRGVLLLMQQRKKINCFDISYTLGTRGNSLHKTLRPLSYFLTSWKINQPISSAGQSKRMQQFKLQCAGLSCWPFT